jgi:hypothetical protein
MMPFANKFEQRLDACMQTRLGIEKDHDAQDCGLNSSANTVWAIATLGCRGE